MPLTRSCGVDSTRSDEKLARALDGVRHTLTGCSLASLVLAIVLVIVLTNKPEQVQSVVVVVVVSMTFGFLSLVVHIIRQWVMFRLPDIRPLNGFTVDATGIEAEFDRIDTDHAQLFASLLLEPARYFVRIAESVLPQAGHTQISAKMSITLPEFTQRMLIPLVISERGELLDGLKIFDGSGHRISSTGRELSVSFTAAVFRRLIHDIGGDELLGAYVSNVEVHVLAVLTSPAADYLPYLLAVDDILALDVPPDARGNLYFVTFLLQELSARSPTFVEFPTDCGSEQPARTAAGIRLRLTVDRDSPLIGRRFDALTGSISKAWLKDIYSNAFLLLKIVIGVRPNNVGVPLDNADRCKSYHLQVDGDPDEVYLGDQHLPIVTDGSRVHVKGRRGQSYSHILIQNGRNYTGRYFSTWFYEIPPGAVGYSAVVAFASLLGLCVFAITQLHWVPGATNTLATALFGLPSAVAAFLGLGRSRRFLSESIVARASTIGSLAASIIGLTATLVLTRSEQYTGTLFSEDIAILRPVLIAWAVLVGAQTLNLIWVGLQFLYRSIVYWFARKS
jgi:hypothetical protein